MACLAGCGARTALGDGDLAPVSGEDAGSSEASFEDAVAGSSRGCFGFPRSPLGLVATCLYLGVPRSDPACDTSGFAPGSCPESDLAGCCVANDSSCPTQAICFYGGSPRGSGPADCSRPGFFCGGGATWQTSAP
jgi:hypothetical protein